MTYAQQIKLERLRAEVKKAYVAWHNSTGKVAKKQAARWIAANSKMDQFLQRIDN